MVVTKTFVWGHLPKAAGDAVAEMLGLFPELIEHADPAGSHLKHAWFRDRPELVEGRQRILCIRRLPTWQLSFSLYKSRKGLHPDYLPLPMESPRQMSMSQAADRHLSPFVEAGKRWPDRWIRVEHLVDDLVAVLSEHVEVTPEKHERLRQLAPRNRGGDYDRDVSSWFTPQMVALLYERNPLWRKAEEIAYPPEL